MRRKGEKPVPRPLLALTPSSPVMRMIADGDTWFSAWAFQQSTPLARLARMTALARAWSVSAEGLMGTLPDKSLVID